MITVHPDNYKGYIRFAELMYDLDPKLAMLALAQAASLNPDLAGKVSRNMRRLVDICSYGPIVTEAEMDRIPAPLVPFLVRSWKSHYVPGLLWTHATVARDRQVFINYRLPRFFSWLYPGRIAGMSTPRNEKDVNALSSMGFTHVLTLTREAPLDPTWFLAREIENVHLPLDNYRAPTLEEMDTVYEMICNGGVWLVHCGGGVGRAGTVLACLIAMLGLDGVGTGQPKLDAQTTIEALRHARPRSLESEIQEKFVSSWISHRWKRLDTARRLDEPVSILDRSTMTPVPDLSIPSVFFLIGKPGSGKSWLSTAIAKRRPRGKTIIISQDESGSRSMCEAHLSRDHPSDVLIILDRCNPSAQDRKLWLALTSRTVIGIFFDYSNDLCRQRINSRLDHSTIRAGRGDNALDQMDRLMHPPRYEEGFTSVLHITSFTAAREAVNLLTPDLPLLKFPRTPHLLNLGATTDDDIVLADFDILKGNLTLEEKVDGANMGISLAYDGSIRVQNRSHWVSSADHAQFKPLDRWMERHRAPLCQILNRDDQYPERFILYGEWVVAKHSIRYDNLPDRFIAFDLFDRLEGTFASRSILARALSKHGIHQVPLLAHTAQVSKTEVMQMLTRSSAYSRERVEGVYVRFEDDKRIQTLQRGKVVRGDFITGNEHWSKGQTVYNNVIMSEGS